MDQLEKVIDQQVQSLAPNEIAGAWRALCGMMLVHTASAFRKKARHRKEEVIASASAKKWVGGSMGRISFDECCDALDLDTNKAKKAMREFADVEKSKPISRVVFGVKVKDG